MRVRVVDGVFEALVMTLCVHSESWLALENFIPFEKFKRLNKRKYFVIPTASHKLHTFVTYKRLI